MNGHVWLSLVSLSLGIVTVNSVQPTCPSLTFSGKVVLVTGGSSGIGADAARHLARLGASVAIVGRNEAQLRAVENQIKQLGLASPLAIVADARTDSERIVRETIQRFGKLDVLLNIAGVLIQDNIANVDMCEFDRVFDTNVRSAIQLTQLCIPYLERTKGNVVSVISVAGRRASPNTISYSISNAALISFTKSSALDLAVKGIRVNAINPSVVRTPLYEKLGWSCAEVEQFFERMKCKLPAGRIAEVQETSAAIAFLADNNRASFLTGVLLPVDGGILLSGGVTLE